jgi:hypothetical protein
LLLSNHCADERVQLADFVLRHQRERRRRNGEIRKGDGVTLAAKHLLHVIAWRPEIDVVARSAERKPFNRFILASITVGAKSRNLSTATDT